jgi:restriction endonuclease S subunit
MQKISLRHNTTTRPNANMKVFKKYPIRIPTKYEEKKKKPQEKDQSDDMCKTQY